MRKKVIPQRQIAQTDEETKLVNKNMQ